MINERTMILPSSLKQMVPLSPQIENEVCSAFKREELPPKYQLQKAGEICKDLYFIEKGMLRIYYCLESGKDITSYFGAENQFLSILYSFYNQTPSNYAIETLEDSVIYTMPMAQFENYRNTYTELEKMYSYVLREFLIETQERVASLQFMSAQQRYNDLLTRQPNIIQRAPLGCIASYLGITQETLSRIRGGK